MDVNFDQSLKKLEDKISQFTNHKSSTYISSIKGIGNKINIKALVVYTLPFVLGAIILSIWKPSFVSTEVEDDQGQYTVHVSFKKVVIASLILGAIIDVLIFLYLRKKEIKL